MYLAWWGLEGTTFQARIRENLRDPPQPLSPYLRPAVFEKIDFALSLLDWFPHLWRIDQTIHPPFVSMVTNRLDYSILREIENRCSYHRPAAGDDSVCHCSVPGCCSPATPTRYRFRFTIGGETSDPRFWSWSDASLISDGTSSDSR